VPAFRKILPHWILSGTLALVCGCVSHEHIAAGQPAPDPTPADAGESAFMRPFEAPALQASPLPVPPDATEGWKRRMGQWLSNWMREQDLEHYREETLAFPATGDNGQPEQLNQVRLYRGTQPGALPLVIILPIWGSYDFPPEQIAWLLRARFAGGIHVAMLEGETRLIEWEHMGDAANTDELRQRASESADRIRVNVIETLRLMDWAATQADVDGDRLGVVGFSMGALVASLVSSNDARPAATVLVMGGADPASILGYCNGRAGETRQSALTRLQLDREAYEQIMRESFAGLNAAEYGGRVDPASVLMVEASADDCMPADSRRALWDAMNRPELVSVEGSHQWAFLAMTPLNGNILSEHIVDFLGERLVPSAPGTTGVGPSP
jgi:dienelactone hydrolase